jgi:hypothetical protein
MQFRPIKSPAAEFRSDKKLCKRLVRIPVYGILYKMIRSFGDKRTERLFWDAVVREFRTIAPRAKRKLEAINAASRLEDLRGAPVKSVGEVEGRPRRLLLNSHQ